MITLILGIGIISGLVVGTIYILSMIGVVYY
jgi:hypothetical protein